MRVAEKPATNQLLERLWEREETPKQRAITTYKDTYQRLPDGPYSVCLPWIEPTPELGGLTPSGLQTLPQQREVFTAMRTTLELYLRAEGVRSPGALREIPRPRPFHYCLTKFLHASSWSAQGGFDHHKVSGSIRHIREDTHWCISQQHTPADTFFVPPPNVSTEQVPASQGSPHIGHLQNVPRSYPGPSRAGLPPVPTPVGGRNHRGTPDEETYIQHLCICLPGHRGATASGQQPFRTIPRCRQDREE